MTKMDVIRRLRNIRLLNCTYEGLVSDMVRRSTELEMLKECLENVELEPIDEEEACGIRSEHSRSMSAIECFLEAKAYDKIKANLRRDYISRQILSHMEVVFYVQD